MSEQTIVKKFCELQQKKYNDFILNSQDHIDLRLFANRITIEGSSSVVLVVRNFNLEILPLMNSPHTQGVITVNCRDIRIIANYSHLGQKTALRIVTNEASEYIFVCKSEKHLSSLLKQLRKKCLKLDEDFEKPLSFWTKLWQEKTISNFQYLLVLNFYGDRSFEDPSQYPIFPWVISNYKTTKLTTPQCLRDMNKPVACLSQDKQDQFKSKNFEIVNKQPKMSPYLDTSTENAY